MIYFSKTTLEERLLQQVTFVKQFVPYYKSAFRNISFVNVESFVEQLPILTKAVVRANSPFDFLSEEILRDPSQIYLQRSTGGTTGIPTSFFYTADDWRLITKIHQQAFKEHLKLIDTPLRAMNCYSQDHVSGPAFGASLLGLGVLVANRSLRPTMEQLLDEIVLHKCNMIIAPPQSSHKGGTISDLLEVDAHRKNPYINGKNIKCLLISSTLLDKELLDELKSLGITNIINCYGSTEAFPIAISVPGDPLNFKITEGHVKTFFINSNGKEARSEERGIVVTSRIAGLDLNRNLTLSKSSSLIHYFNDDEVLYYERKNCDGEVERFLTDAVRIQNIEEKLASGCQVW